MTAQNISLIRKTSIAGITETLSSENFDSLSDLFDTLKGQYRLPVSPENEVEIAKNPFTEFRNRELINGGDAAWSGTVTYQISIN